MSELRLALRLARARRPARATRPSVRSLTAGRTPPRSARRAPSITRPLPLRHPIHRSRLLHLLARTDRVAVLEKLRECRPRALSDLVLQLLGQIRKGDVRVDCLDVPKQLVGKSSRCGLQRGDPIEDSREDDRLHDFVGGSGHVVPVVLLRGGLEPARFLSARRT